MRLRDCIRLGIGGVLLFSGVVCVSPAAEVPGELQRWMGPQVWQRDVDGPVLSLGKPGEFDDTHVFAPMVAVDRGQFMMWYCGSLGRARDLAERPVPDERVFRLGLATSQDGKRFERHPGWPVFALDEPGVSVLTPCVVRNADGSVLREGGRMRMWFSSAAFAPGGRGHCIQETSSADGVHWAKASAPLLQRAYAPTVVKTQRGYEMWYTEPGKYPWLIRHAHSDDGHKWSVTRRPVLEITQDWEHAVVIYPSVSLSDGVYVMWYASYMQEDHKKTAIGFAASLDGLKWYKHPQNPVLRPDHSRPWESHYVSSQSVVRLADGSFRIWYASRKRPPFTNLYFALNTACWSGPQRAGDSENGSSSVD